MMKLESNGYAVLLTGILVIGLWSGLSVAKEEALTDQQIHKILIQKSISSYPGNCPCPYNSAKNGSRCGKRSAYSRAGGYSPLCYDKDITTKMINNYRKSH